MINRRVIQTVLLTRKNPEALCNRTWVSALCVFVDDGFSGTNFNRPDFQRMIAEVEAGRIKRVIVKDMSRLGRDYLQVGMYTEIMFPNLDVHFIAVNDGVDSHVGENEFTPFRNIINEWYAKDTSKKSVQSNVLKEWQASISVLTLLMAT